MSLPQMLILLVLVGYAIYRQSQRHEVIGSTRFTLAAVYAVVGLVIGGFSPPVGVWSIGLLTVSLLLSIGVGVLRGRYTSVWSESGRVYAQGTALTISLFVGLVLVKVGLGTAAYFAHVSDNGGFGEVLLMIALMVGFQAQIIWRRAQPLGARPTAHAEPVDATPAEPAPVTR